MTIIAIAGGTGSGKTTVVKKIVEALPPHSVAVVPLDSYYNDTTDLTDEERRQINFDHPDAFVHAEEGGGHRAAHLQLCAQ